MIYWCNFEENTSTGSKDFPHREDYDLENEDKIMKISRACHKDILMQVRRNSIHWFKTYANSKALALKIRPRIPKSNKFLSLSQWFIDAILKKIHSLLQKTFYLQDYDLENEVKVTKIKSALKLVTVIFWCKLEENAFTGSKDILLRRLWPLKWVQGHQNLIKSKLVTMIYWCKFEENPSFGSEDIQFQDYDLEKRSRSPKTN